MDGEFLTQSSGHAERLAAAQRFHTVVARALLGKKSKPLSLSEEGVRCFLSSFI